MIDVFRNGPYYNGIKSQYEYIVNDYNNEQDLTYEEIFNVLKDRIYDYHYGYNTSKYEGYDNRLVYRTINNKKIVVAVHTMDSVLAFAWNNTNNIEFKMGVSNASNLGIDNTDLWNEEIVVPEILL